MKNPAKTLHKTLSDLGGRRERTPKSRRDLNGGTIYHFDDGWQILTRRDVSETYAVEIIDQVRAHFGLEQMPRPAPKVRPVKSTPPQPRIGPKSDVTLTPHAAERFRLMARQAKVSQRELGQALLNPERVEYDAGHDSWGYTGPRIKVDVAVNGARIVIKTIEWSRDELWQLYPRPKKAAQLTH